MKILIESLAPVNPKTGEDTYAEISPGNACVRVTEAFSAVVFETEDGARYGVALRDSGLEVVCPAGDVVGIKRTCLGPHSTFVEVNGNVVASKCAACGRTAPLADGECPDCRH